MKNRRLKKFMFSREMLNDKLLDKRILTLIFETMPDDFIFVGWGDEFMSNSSYIIVQSSEFDEVSQCCVIPEGILKFNKDNNGIVTCKIEY